MQKIQLRVTVYIQSVMYFYMLHQLIFQSMAIKLKFKATFCGGIGSKKMHEEIYSLYVLKIIQRSSNSLLFLTRFMQHGNFQNKNSQCIRHRSSRSASAGHSCSLFPLIEINFIQLTLSETILVQLQVLVYNMSVS